MDLLEKRKLELENKKALKKKEIIEVAIKVFDELGIENAKMTDVAKRAEVGVASVYRYFNTKGELLIDCGLEHWERMISKYYKDFLTEKYTSLNGIEQVRAILMVFFRIYMEDKHFYKFLEEFDNYILKENVLIDKLNLYEKKILSLMPVMLEALKKGKSDNSISRTIDEMSFYMSITHTLISLCQKLISRNNVLTSDRKVEGETQIMLIIEMAINYIKS